MKSGKKIFCAIVMLGLMCTTVFAVSHVEEITALLNYGITIEYNNEAQTFKDVTGGRVYPISYNGTTYLPVRAVANLFDIDVEWDEANNAVLLEK